MRQLVSNLVNNAIKFTSYGGVSIDVRQEIHPEKGLLLHVAVVDTGIGIPANDVGRLFRPFVQLDGSRRYGGTGLGLAICRNIVNAMGGDISVTTGEGRGSTFTFFVHVEPDVSGLAVTRADHGKSVKTIASTSDARAFNVLVADDDQIMRSLITVMLEREGHRVTTVENGAEAIAAIQRMPFDIVLLDMQMPVMDGLTALRTIRRQENGQENEGGAARARSSVIALSADVRNEQKERVRVGGADVVLGKPIEWERLFAEMRALFLRASLSRAPSSSVPSPAPATRDAAALSSDVIENLRVQIGNQALDRVLRKFADGLQQYVGAMSAALNVRDLQRVRRIAHSLHGLSAQFGAFEVSALSSLVARRSCSLEQASEIAPQIVIAASNVREALADKFGIAA